jgi:two-component system response regulator PilR (NtrC family)
MQVKLLRVLQERRFRRVGGTQEVEADIRVIAATNRDLARAVAEGHFREDLFYRVNVIPVALPPLRERRDDIGLLAAHFVARFAHQMGKDVRGISREAMACLECHPWPGNVRELENALERAVALEQTPMVLPDSLPDAVRGVLAGGGIARGVETAAAGPAPVPPGDSWPPDGFDLERHVQDIERQCIAEALRRANGVKVRAAELLGMSFRSFRYYLKKYEIS